MQNQTNRDAELEAELRTMPSAEAAAQLSKERGAELRLRWMAHCDLWGKEPLTMNCAETNWVYCQTFMGEERRQNAINSVLSRSLAVKAREQIKTMKGS